MKPSLYKVKSKVWLYPGAAAWHFVSIPKKQSDDIKKRFATVKRGWGSLRVVVTLGKTSWKTSIFPDKRSGEFLLPLKADVRKKEGIQYDDTVSFLLNVKG